MRWQVRGFLFFVFSESTVRKLPITFSKTDFIRTSQSFKSLYLTLFRGATVPIQLVGSGILGKKTLFVKGQLSPLGFRKAAGVGEPLLLRVLLKQQSLPSGSFEDTAKSPSDAKDGD